MGVVRSKNKSKVQSPKSAKRLMVFRCSFLVWGSDLMLRAGRKNSFMRLKARGERSEKVGAVFHGSGGGADAGAAMAFFWRVRMGALLLLER